MKWENYMKDDMDANMENNMKMNQKNALYDKYAFGKFIRKRRNELKLTIKQLAETMQISTIYLRDIEKGNRMLPLISQKGKENLKILVEALHISKDEEESFYKMFIAMRGFDESLQEYVKNNKYLLEAVRLSKEVNLSDEEWKYIIYYIKNSN